MEVGPQAGSKQFKFLQHSYVKPVPALDLWRAELAAGVDGQQLEVPRTWKFDALYRAACAEMWALEHEKQGQYEVAETYRVDAQQILAEVYRRESAA